MSIDGPVGIKEVRIALNLLHDMLHAGSVLSEQILQADAKIAVLGKFIEEVAIEASARIDHPVYGITQMNVAATGI